MDLTPNRSILQDKTNLISETNPIKQSGKGLRNPVEKVSEVPSPTSKNLEKSASKQTVSSDSCSFNSALGSKEVESDTDATAEYDSAGDNEFILAPESAEPAENLNLTLLANSLDGLHIATPQRNTHSPHDCSLFAVKFSKSEFPPKDQEELSSEADSSIVGSDQENDGSLSGVLNLSNVSIEEITIAGTTPLEFLASVENFENRRLSAARNLDRVESNENNSTVNDNFSVIESQHSVVNQLNDTDNSRSFSGIPNLSNISYEEVCLTGITPLGFIASAENFENIPLSATNDIATSDSPTIKTELDEKDLIGETPLEFIASTENIQLSAPENISGDTPSVETELYKKDLIEDKSPLEETESDLPKHEGKSCNSAQENTEKLSEQLLLNPKQEFDGKLEADSQVDNFNNSLVAACESSAPQKTNSCNISSGSLCISDEIAIDSSGIVDKLDASKCSNVDNKINESSETDSVDSPDILKPDLYHTIETVVSQTPVSSTNSPREESTNLRESLTGFEVRETVDNVLDFLKTPSSLKTSHVSVEDPVATVATQDSNVDISNQDTLKEPSLSGLENAGDLKSDSPDNVSISKELTVTITDDLTETVISDLLAKAESCGSSQLQDKGQDLSNLVEEVVSVNGNIELECNDTKLECPETISNVHKECLTDQVSTTENSLGEIDRVQSPENILNVQTSHLDTSINKLDCSTVQTLSDGSLSVKKVDTSNDTTLLKEITDELIGEEVGKETLPTVEKTAGPLKNEGSFNEDLPVDELESTITLENAEGISESLKNNQEIEKETPLTSLDESLPLLDAIDESFELRTENKLENVDSGSKSSEKVKYPEQESETVSSKFCIANLNKSDSYEPIKESSAILDNTPANDTKACFSEPFDNCLNQASLNGPDTLPPIEDLKNNNFPVVKSEDTAPKSLIENTSTNSTNNTKKGEETSHGIDVITENVNKCFSRKLDYTAYPQSIEVPAVDELKNKESVIEEKDILEEAINKLSIKICDDLLKENSPLNVDTSKSPINTFPVDSACFTADSTSNSGISPIASDCKQFVEDTNAVEVQLKSACSSEFPKIVPIDPNSEISEKNGNIEEVNFDDSLTEQALNLSREILSTVEEMSDNYTAEMDNRLSSPAKSGDTKLSSFSHESNGLGNHGAGVDLDKTFEKQSESPAFDSVANNSEAGPVTAEEFSIPASAYQFDLDSLPCGARDPRSRLTRNSLYVKFDPIVGKILANTENSPVHLLPQVSERLVESSLQRTPMKNPTLDDKLISLTPCNTVDTGDANSSVSELDYSVDTVFNNTIENANLNKTDPDLTQRVRNLSLDSSSSTPQANKLQTSKSIPRGTVVSQEFYLKELEKLQDLMSKQEQGYQEELNRNTEKMEKLQVEVSTLKKEMHSKTKALSQSNVVLGEYERTISQLLAQNEADKKQFELLKEKLIQERDTVTLHLNNTEIAFNDVHQKYERSKTVIEEMKNIQDTLKTSNQEYEKLLKAQEEKYNKLRSHVAGQLEKANHEMEAMMRSHQAENEKLKAKLKQAEISIKSLENSNEHKSKENKELTQILDELIGKVGADGV